MGANPIVHPNIMDYKQQVEDLRTRAAIRRKATGRKSVEEGKVDRLAKQLDDAADTIEKLMKELVEKESHIEDLGYEMMEMSDQCD